MTAMARRIAWALVVLLGAGTLSAPTVAGADGDPASDYLLAQNVFYPYQPPVAQSLQRVLNAETAATKRAGLSLKVALIHSPADLGAIPTAFGRPHEYADFLDHEISFRGPQPLLVVMPDGYGVAGLPAAVSAAVPSLRLPAGRTSDDLARAAVPAIARIAAATGHPIAAPAVPSPGSGAATAGGRPLWVIGVALAVAALAAAGGVLSLRRRRTRRRHPRQRAAVRTRRGPSRKYARIRGTPGGASAGLRPARHPASPEWAAPASSGCPRSLV